MTRCTLRLWRFEVSAGPLDSIWNSKNKLIYIALSFPGSIEKAVEACKEYLEPQSSVQVVHAEDLG